MRIVIAGGGFGGVKAALELSRDPHMKIVLVSDRDDFLYYPALYATTTGHSHRESSIPLQTIFADHPNVQIIRDTVTGIDIERRSLIGDQSHYHYDSLICALGVVTTYFGIPGLNEHAYGIKTSNEVKKLKDHLHQQMEQDHHYDKNYVIIGAGATGVELSAALATYLSMVAKRHKVKRGKAHISLVEAAPRVLPRMSERASSIVTNRLQSLGVKVMTNHKVETADESSITVDGRKIPSQSIVWTSGVTNNPFFASLGNTFNLAKNGKVEVDEYLRATPHVYVIGDNAATPYSGLAQTALHDADYVASQLIALRKNRSVKPYASRKPPVVIPVGENWAICEWGPVSFGGLAGGLLRQAADFIGYDDVLPFDKAMSVWLSQFEHEESCTVCSKPAHATASF